MEVKRAGLSTFLSRQWYGCIFTKQYWTNEIDSPVFPSSSLRVATLAGPSRVRAPRTVPFFSSNAFGEVDGDFFFEREGVGASVIGYWGISGVVAIPEQLGGLPVTAIGNGAFYDRTSLTSVTIPNGVTSIGYNVFYGCTRLTHVTIPSSVTSMGGGVFFGCTGLTNVTIPHSVTTIGDSAFLGCTGLTSITIPNSVISIEAYGFSGCTGLTSVMIPNGVTSFREGAFADCTGLTSVTIPNSVTRIREGAFWDCRGLTRVMIPSSVTIIEGSTFVNCTGLAGVYFQGETPAIQGSGTFERAGQVSVYYLPGSAGWGSTFGGRPTAPWLPQVRTGDASFGVRENQFGFDVSWAPGKSVVVEASTELGDAAWSPLQTLTLTGDSIHFSDPQWRSQPVRFYRLRTP